MAESAKPEPLNKDQVNYALDLIKELHPLEGRPYHDVYPALKYLCCCCTCLPTLSGAGTADDQPAEQEPLLDEEATQGDFITIAGKEVKKKKQKKRKNPAAKQKREDPLEELGFGIVAYNEMMYKFTGLFILFSILMAPAIYFYGLGTGYQFVPAALQGYEVRTLGNLGYSTVQCQSIPVAVGKLSVSCPYGVVGEFFDYGINHASDGGASDSCVTTQYNSDCKPDSTEFAAALDQAIGQNEFTGTVDTALLFDPLDGHDHSACLEVDDLPQLFVQFSCIQTDEQLFTKYSQLSIVVAMACLIAMLFTITLKSLYQGGKIKMLEWDIATITAGDYTVELKVCRDEYRDWYDTQYKTGEDFSDDVAPAMSFKKHLKKVIEDQLNEELANGNLGKNTSGHQKKNDQQLSEVKIADITFAFNNQNLINALRVRGGLIAVQNFDAMREQEKKIQELFDSTEEFETLTTPTAAFITFEEEDAKLLALQNPDSRVEFLGKKLNFAETSEPTDIIWENRHWTAAEIFGREMRAAVIATLLICLSAWFIYWVSSLSSEVKRVFPPVDCDALATNYGSEFDEFAVADYDFISANPGMKSSGCLQCFCQQQIVDDPEGASTDAYGQADGVPICNEYYLLMLKVLFWSNSISYFLVLGNMFLRKACEALVDWIGYDTETVRLEKKTTIVFILQFFNTAILLLMINTNWSEQFFAFGLTKGDLSDFNGQWFATVGSTMIYTMVFNSVYPVMEACGYWGLRLLYRLLDGTLCNKFSTKSTSIQAYINLTAGPVYYMYFKYSTIQNIVFVTFMFGFGCPVLFPTAAFSFLVLYITERTMLFKAYQLPPMYDARLSESVLNKLRLAPLFLMLFGYWMVSSQQLLRNDNLAPVAQGSDIAKSNHLFQSVFSEQGWEGLEWPMAGTFLFLLFLYFFGEHIQNCLYKCIPALEIGDITIDEEIDNYWKSLDAEDRKWSLREETNARDACHMKILTDEQHDALNGSEQTDGKTLQGVHSYDILANPLYLDDFQYVTAAEDDRNEMIIDDDAEEGNDAAQSDMVRICLNLAYLTEKEALGFTFGKQAAQALNSARSNEIN